MFKQWIARWGQIVEGFALLVTFTLKTKNLEWPVSRKGTDVGCSALVTHGNLGR